MSRVAEHLAALIRVPSVSSLSNRGVIAYASATLARAAWSLAEVCYRDEHGVEKVNLMAAPPSQSLQDRDVELALVCHTDTVPYPADWDDAVTPREVDGRLHGCGACDVKGFLACLLTVAEEWRSRRPGVRIVLTADEEIGCIGTKRLIEAHALRPRRMVIGEPSSLQPARAGKGYCLASVQIHGREAHSAHPGQGVSAIYAAARAVSALERIAGELECEVHPFFTPGFTTLNVGTIAGGTAKNIVPASAACLVEWRPIPGQPATRVPDAIRAALDEITAHTHGVTADLRPLRQQDGFETAADAPLVRSLEHLTGRPASSISFGSEASLWSALCSEVVVFGPGDMQTAHSRRECVPLAELDQAVQVLHHLLQYEW